MHDKSKCFMMFLLISIKEVMNEGCLILVNILWNWLEAPLSWMRDSRQIDSEPIRLKEQLGQFSWISTPVTSLLPLRTMGEWGGGGGLGGGGSELIQSPI